MAAPTLPTDLVAADEILTERSGSILSIQLNRPAKKNAMTSRMYTAMSELLDSADADDSIRVVLWYGAGDSFSAGNDLSDFLNNPPARGVNPQDALIESLV